ncbi:uncharacterized protein [Cicer arietinum]|uniref:uncharacterized protein n=1 Tax=Cicer arietinum TaxID=3827 RepID=UPI003CC5C03B
MASNNIALPAPPVFTGNNYEIWSVKMRTQLRAYDLWEVVETTTEPPPLQENPTIAQMRYHSEQVAKRDKAITILHSAVNDDVFMRISHLETTKQVWEKLEEEFFRNERTKQMQVLNLKREFEALKMNEAETINDFMTKVMKVVTQIRLLGEEFLDSRIVEKVLVVLPERFESKISSLEESKDLSKISLTKLTNALQAQEQRRLLRQEEATKSSLQVKHKEKAIKVKDEKKFVGQHYGKDTKKKERFLKCGICKRTSHNDSDCWYKGKTPPPIQCRYCNKNGHIERFCRLKQQQKNQQSHTSQKLWHKRFDHYNLKSIQFSQKKKLVKGLPNTQMCSEVCEGCQLGKQHRLPFPSSATWRANKKLELVHSDVCGPMNTTSLHALVETQSGYFLKKLRTDNGKEFVSTESLAAQMKWKIWHLNVKSTFLNGNLDEEIYVAQPDGFLVKGREEMVYKLHKALYGLKQAPRVWYNKIDSHFHNQDFRRSENDATLYVRRLLDGGSLIVSLYVDDLLVTSNNQQEVQKLVEDMKNQFEMSSLGEMNYFLGLEVYQSEDEIFLNQEKYAREILKKFRMESCKSVPTPLVSNLKLSKEDETEKIDASLYRSLIRSLLYLTSSRPDLMYATSLLSRFMQSPTKTHFAAVKRVLRYVKGITQFGIWYKPSENESLIGYIDSDWVGNIDDMKSTTSYAFSLGSALVETQSGYFLKKLRTDNGKEFVSTECNKFCDELGAERQLTVSYSPQQNGVYERKNRHVLEMARCMIFEKKLPKSFWAEAVNTADGTHGSKKFWKPVYLQNRLPTRAVEGMTPIEAWGGIKTSIKHLRVFGSLCYTHIPEIKRTKLDEKAEKGILIGYSSKSKGYKVYGIDSDPIAISENPVQHGKTKHIQVKFHDIREAIKSQEIKLAHCVRTLKFLIY